MSRKAKWTISLVTICLVLVAVGLIIYFCLFNKNTYSVVKTEHTEFTASEFQNSELRFFGNGTFHLKIIHGENEVFFLGIGTYTKHGSNYTFTFTQAVGREGDDLITNQMEKFQKPMTYHKSGNKIKFSDHNGQVYYFG